MRLLHRLTMGHDGVTLTNLLMAPSPSFLLSHTVKGNTFPPFGNGRNIMCFLVYYKIRMEINPYDVIICHAVLG